MENYDSINWKSSALDKQRSHEDCEKENSQEFQSEEDKLENITKALESCPYVKVEKKKININKKGINKKYLTKEPAEPNSKKSNDHSSGSLHHNVQQHESMVPFSGHQERKGYTSNNSEKVNSDTEEVISELAYKRLHPFLYKLTEFIKDLFYGLGTMVGGAFKLVFWILFIWGALKLLFGGGSGGSDWDSMRIRP